MNSHQFIQKNAHPAFAKGWEKFAKEKWKAKNTTQAIAAYQHALSLDETLATAWCDLGILGSANSHIASAEQAYQKALALKPEWQLGIEFMQCFRYLLNVYDTPEEVLDCYQKFEAALSEFYNKFQTLSTDEIKGLYHWIGYVGMFLLPYQGVATRHLQKIYGQIIHQVMTTVIPEGKQRPPMPELAADQPLRVGVVCGFFRRQTVFKLMLDNWIKYLNKDKIRIYAYYPRDYSDECTEKIKRHCYQFSMGNGSTEAWFKKIREDNLHLLIFPEIGMDLEVVKLASLWLAPIQCMSWGHPDTCGLPTIEYFLSSELMEPEEGDLDYCETLIRLKNLGIQFSPHQEDEREPITREEFGFKPDTVIYGCLQTWYKYLPHFDYVYPEIAAAVGNCQFVFITHLMSQHSRQRFEGRLERAFAAKNLDWREYCFLSRPLNFYGFTSMLHCLDIFLDSIEWSGGCTTLEALHYAQVPIVTTPGRFMRGRHTAGILTQLGLPELIAPNVSSYIQKAIELGQNVAYRQFIHEKIQTHLPRVMADQEGMKSLEAFILQTVNSYGESR
ncbi:hypothetical protein RYO59_002078 [Thermosynechococcaceae cyanobacterium Okahandja]